MSAAQFLESLYGSLPELFKDEDELRKLWSIPETREQLLRQLSDKGFSKERLSDIQKIVDAEKSDIFDVLAYVAFATQPLTREARATKAKVKIPKHFSKKQQEFIAFVLSHYVQEGVEELQIDKLSALLRLKYGTIADAGHELGAPKNIGEMFAEFQKYLYQ
jgi:type I restriction enzyme, R subunit